MRAEEWEVAAAALLGHFGGTTPWDDGASIWLPLAQKVRTDLEGALVACPEGAVTILAHALPMLEKEEGESVSLEIVKLLYHLLGTGRLLLPSPDATSPWQQHWLLAVTSIIRFMYIKWVTVPQDPKLTGLPSATNIIAPAAPAMQKHHAFLFRQMATDFTQSGVYDLKITENSVLFSEAFAFAAFCRLHEVDLVLESGVYKGVSTEVWSLFAQDVVAIDIFISPEAEARLAPRRSVHLVTGDGRQVLPRLLQEHSDRRTAVFIDGPKGELAIRLALSLATYPQVAFVALHDMAPYRTELTRLGVFFFSDESWFQEAYGHLDAPFHARPDLVAGGTMAFLPGASQAQVQGLGKPT